MADFKIKLDPGAQKQLGPLVRRQLPFATSLALNLLTKAAKNEQTEGMLQRFTVRQPARLKTAVRMRASSKRMLRTELMIQDDFLIQHEEGGIRRPGDVHSSIVRPVRQAERRIGMLRGRGSPKAVMNAIAKRGFVATMPRSGKVGIFVRKRQTRLPIELVFAFEREVKIPALLKFGWTVVHVVQRDWERMFATALDRALATAR